MRQQKELIIMPAITVDNPLVLPRITAPDPAASHARPVAGRFGPYASA